MTAIDWQKKPEPWRTIGLDFVREALETRGWRANYWPRVWRGRHLRAARLKRGWKAKQVAWRIGCKNENVIYDMEAERYRGRFFPLYIKLMNDVSL